MAYSYVRYSGNGSTTNYTFSFPTISTDHIKVRVNGTLVTNWSFLNSSTIQFAAAPASGAVIDIRRETPKDSPIVNFTDGSVLLERDLDLLATYDLYLAQETKDGLDSSISQTSLGVFDGQNKRITNVADPVAAQDVSTKAYTDAIVSVAAIEADAAEASAAAAAVSEASALASKNAASASAISAGNDKNTVQALTAQLQDGVRQVFDAGTNFTADVTTSLTLLSSPAKAQAVFVFFNGVCQDQAGYTVSGASLNFAQAIPNVHVEVVYFTPSQLVGLTNSDLAQLASAVSSTEASKIAAVNSATTAVAAKTAAETARDAANVSGRVYATTAAGIAATTNGQYFSIPSPENAEYLILYLNSSGTAVEKKRYPSTAALDFVKSQPVADVLPVFSVTDDSDNIAFEVTRSGGLRTKLFQVSDVGEIETTAVSAVLSASPTYVYSVTDALGNIIFGIDNLGRLVANFDLVPAPTQPAAEPQGPLYDYSVNQIFGYGQSLSVGQAYPALSVSQNYDNLRFTRGMRPVYDYPAESAAQWYASLIPAVEENNASGYVGVLGETPSMGTADMIKERILAEDGKSYTQHQYQILISTPGYGATTISQLSKGGVHFARMVEQATYGKTLANAAGKSHAVQAVTWTQGESDYLSGTTQAAYVTALNSLIADINTDIKAVTGQTKSIPVIGCQISSHITYASDDFPDIALAQLEVEAANPLFYIACAMYPFSYHSGGHISNVSTRWLGGYYGLAYKRIVINGEDWMPLKPIASVRQSNFVEIRFHVPDGPLVFDTSQVSAQTNYGFQLLDSSGVAITITSVAIIDTDRVRITASTAIPSGAKVRYAFTGDSVTGKGNLRDSQGDTITFAIPGSTAKRMDNWCLIFELSI